MDINEDTRVPFNKFNRPTIIPAIHHCVAFNKAQFEVQGGQKVLKR